MKFKKCLFQETGNPYPLKQNAGKSFQGSIVLGKGFVLSPEEAEKLIKKDPRNKDVLFPYLNGDDLNNDPEQKPSRWVINFFDWTEEKARTYPDCFEIVERLVKPERLKQNDKGGIEKWWQFLRPRNELYRIISQLDQVMVIAQVSKTSAFEFTNPSKVLDAKLNIFALNEYFFFLLMQSNLHVQWAWKYSSTMKTDLSYAPTQVFETFPFIKDISSNQIERLNQIGRKYYDFRKELMSSLGLGLTKTYNLFHNKHIVELTIQDELLDDNAFEKKFGKNSLSFRKHLIKHAVAMPYNTTVKDILYLRRLHIEIDNAALSYFGWADIDLRHDFYDVEYLSENDRNRFTIHPIARKEILKRLLQLNHDLYNKSELNKQSDNKLSKYLPIVDFFTELG